MRFDSDGNIWIRQSWLDTAMRCAERGRLAIVKPEWDIGGDAAHLGNGTHRVIEYTLNERGGEPIEDRELIRSIAHTEITNLIATEGIRWNKYTTVTQLVDNAERCYVAWRDSILPILHERNLIEGGRAEVKFRFVLFTLADGRTVGMEGTADFVPKAPELWDWKTAGQAFRDREKQRFAVQPTAYGAAAVLGALRDDVDYSWPIDFTYGIAIRGVRKSTPQLLKVTRTQAHFDFMVERLKSYVDLALNFTLDRAWPRNDDHFLCSEAWCAWWRICKGAHAIDDSIPVQLTLKAA